MSAPIKSTILPAWASLVFHPPGQKPSEAIGIFVFCSNGRFLYKVKRSIHHADAAVKEVWTAMRREFEEQTAGLETIARLEQDGSHTFTFSQRIPLIHANDLQDELQRLYSQHVAPEPKKLKNNTTK